MIVKIYDKHGRDVTSIVDFIFNQNGNVNTYLAAPELLEALKEFVREYEGFEDGNGDPCPTLARAIKTIAKATGDE